jgi:8-oxo-dGTP diphosphatase
MVKIAGGVVWNQKLGVVVVNQNHNSWSLPKGHIEKGEESLAAALREIREESGIPERSLTLVREVAHYTRKRMKLRDGDTDEMRDIVLYFFTTNHEQLTPEDPMNPEALWVPPSAVPDLLTNTIDKKEFARIIASDVFQ